MIATGIKEVRLSEVNNDDDNRLGQTWVRSGLSCAIFGLAWVWSKLDWVEVFP